MSAAHTPGPWFLLESDGVLQISDSEKHGNKAAIVHWAGFDAGDKTKKAKRANARLIAAAPDLLDALEAMLREFTGQNYCAPDEYPVAKLGAMRKAKEAIAKATGS